MQTYHMARIANRKVVTVQQEREGGGGGGGKGRQVLVTQAEQFGEFPTL